MKKIAVGMFYHEANSFNPYKLKKSGFSYYTGEEVIDKVYASEIFQKEGYELVPLIYAVALPNGIVEKETYEYYSNQILEIINNNKDLDGVFLHLHGSMEVEGLGSGEYDLIKRIRDVIGMDKVIGIALDIHANTDPRLPELTNVMRNYRTVPHTDQKETEQAVAAHMVECLESGQRTIPEFIQLPYAMHPEKALGATWPMNEILERLNRMEREIDEISIATLGVGMIWCDVPTLKTNVTITPKKEEYSSIAKSEAKKLADYIYTLRDSFEYEQLPLFPKDARRFSLEYKESPVFVSDSGDNTTGGAVGDSSLMLKEYLNARSLNGKKVIVTSIWDEKAIEVCKSYNEGDKIKLNIGRGSSELSQPFEVEGILKKKGNLNGYMGLEDDAVGKCVTISAGDLDFVITDKPGSFIAVRHFAAAGLDISDYDVIVVKQGYLFPELRLLSKLAILALSKGANYQLIEDLEYKNIEPPVYPLKYKK